MIGFLCSNFVQLSNLFEPGQVPDFFCCKALFVICYLLLPYLVWLWKGIARAADV